MSEKVIEQLYVMRWLVVMSGHFFRKRMIV